MVTNAPTANGDRCALLERTLKRETAARKQAESLLETRSRDLYHASEKIKEQHQRVSRRNQQLEEAHTALQSAQAQLVQSEKLASVGQLAAGVAHEINNPVGFIMSNLGTLRGYADALETLVGKYRDYIASVEAGTPNTDLLVAARNLEKEEDVEFILDDLRDLISESIDGTERVKDIVQGLKNFSRIDEAEQTAVDIHEGIESTLKILANELKYTCTIEKEFGELPPIVCNLAKLNQVFMNLLINAGQAIDGQGKILLTTRVESQFAVIDVADTGTGIPEENLSSIFDPFFTTKEIGSGTGLGLSISHGIIEEHGGTLTVESTVGEGTTFTIRLPLEAATSSC